MKVRKIFRLTHQKITLPRTHQVGCLEKWKVTSEMFFLCFQARWKRKTLKLLLKLELLMRTFPLNFVLRLSLEIFARFAPISSLLHIKIHEKNGSICDFSSTSRHFIHLSSLIFPSTFPSIQLHNFFIKHFANSFSIFKRKQFLKFEIPRFIRD